MSYASGRHFLQIPGPTNVPERVLRAIGQATIDHRGPEFSRLAIDVFQGLQKVFKTSGTVVIYPSSGTGAWEASLVNTLSPGDKVLMFETGYFAALWREVALKLGLEVDFVPGDWRRGVDPAVVEAKLGADRERKIQAVAVVHNETSTGATSRVDAVRKAIDRAGHPALLMVDTISSLASIDYRHDEWGVDVTVCCSQKGLMLPPGLGLNAVSAKALEASKTARLPRSYWDWQAMVRDNKAGLFPLHAGHQPALRPARIAAHAVRGGARRGSSRGTCATPKPPGVRFAPGGSRSCARTRPNTARRSPPW